MQRQIFFDDETSGLCYLSPYTDVYRINKNRIIFKRYDTGQSIEFSISSKWALDSILVNLLKGIQEEQLIEMMGTKTILEICRERGVIE